jgi:uncharacterized protein (DUF1330 family)
MSKGYWVAFADVNDPEGYKAYVAENAKAIRKYGGPFLTRGGKSESPEGKPRSRAVEIEFPNYAAAPECYRSPEYAAAMTLRRGKSIMDLAIVRVTRAPSLQTVRRCHFLLSAA